MTDNVLAYNLQDGQLMSVPVELDFTSFRPTHSGTQISLKGDQFILGVWRDGDSHLEACYLLRFQGDSWQLVKKILAPGDYHVQSNFSEGMGLSDHWMGIGSKPFNGFGAVYLVPIP